MMMIRLVVEDSILSEVTAGNYALAGVLIQGGTREEITAENVCELCCELNGPLSIEDDPICLCQEANIEIDCKEGRR